MRIFGQAEALHYCSLFTSQPGLAEGPIRDYFKLGLGGTNQRIREGSQQFEEFRSCSLRDVERSLFLAASHYRRCLDLAIASSASWAHVTVYYGSFYSARAILGLFGVTVLSKKVIDVSRSSPGRQELRVRSIGNGRGKQPSTYSGSHRQFWDLFYMAMTPLKPQLPSNLAFGFAPVSANPIWQIEERNRVNYDPVSAIQMTEDFQSSFLPSTFPLSLPSSLTTQFRVFEALLEIAFLYSSQFGLQTDALNNLVPAGDLRTKVRELVYKPRAPGLVRMTKKKILI